MNRLTLLVSLFLCGSTITVQGQDVDVTFRDVLNRLQQLEQQQRLSDILISQLTDTTEQQRSLIASHEERIAELEDELDQEQRKNEALQSQVLANRQSLVDFHRLFVRAVRKEGKVPVPATLKNKIDKRQERQNLAFTAYLDHPVNYGSGDTIKFNKIVTNEGHGYSVHTGVFTCPESGLYLFSFAVWQKMEGSSWQKTYVNLKVNDQPIVDVLVDTFHTTQDIQGGNTAVVRLNQGDAVWVSVTSNNHIHGGSLHATSFTGVYLHN